MIFTLRTKAALIVAAAFLALTFCVHVAHSGQQTEQAQRTSLSTAKHVDNLPLDGLPATSILPSEKQLCSLTAVICADEQTEQAPVVAPKPALKLAPKLKPVQAKPATTKPTVTVQLPVPDIAQLVAGTGFEGHEQAIIDAAKKYNVDPKLLIGIANAESSVGLHCLHNNCFGIMAYGHVLHSYETLDEGIADAARFIREKMHDRGRFTPEEIVCGYVGQCSQSWITNVNKYYVSRNNP
jgi:hypothetical protein